jgi:hypothetical protein
MMGGILKIRGLGQGDSQVQPMGFIYSKAPGKIYHEPNLCRSQGVGVGGRYIMSTPQ